MPYFEDLSVGETDSHGSRRVTAEDIVRFGERYDPQAIHTDPEAAADSMFGGLVASGWHTAAVTMAMLVESRLRDARALGAIGVDELRFRAPVRPGDELAVETEIVEKEPWDDERGLVHVGCETRTAAGESVLTMTGLVLWERRQAQKSATA